MVAVNQVSPGMSNKAAIVLSLIVIGAVFLVLEKVHLANNNHLWSTVQNAGHIPLFGILSLVMLALSKRLLGDRISRRYVHYLLAFWLTVTIAGCSELMQYFGPRDADFHDLLMDVLGAASFLGLYITSDRRMATTWRKIGKFGKTPVRLGSLLLLAAAFTQPALWGLAYHYRRQAFPQICSFESYWENKFLIAQNAELTIVSPPNSWAGGGDNRVGKLTLKPAAYPGLMVREPYPDWTGYDFLAFTVYSELDHSISLGLRIDDIHHNYLYEDRFTRKLTIEQGLNRFQIPLVEVRRAPAKREMDMANIAMILLFASRPRGQYVIYIDNFRLE